MDRTTLLTASFVIALAGAGSAQDAGAQGQPTDRPAAATTAQPDADAPPQGDAQTPPGDAASDQPTENRGVVTRVEGLVQVKTGEEDPKQAVTVGRVLPLGTTIYTGPNSSITVRVGENQLYTFDSVTRATLREAVRERAAMEEDRGGTAGDTDRTRIDLVYGGVSFDVRSAGVNNDVAIATPDSTLDVSGTRGALRVQGRDVSAFGAQGNTGRFTVTYNASGRKATISDDAETSQDAPAPAEMAANSASTETGGARARSEAEDKAASRNTGGGEPLRQNTGLTGPPPPRRGDPNLQLEDNVGGDIDDLPQSPGGGNGGSGGGMDPGPEPDPDTDPDPDPDTDPGTDPEPTPGGPLGSLIGANFIANQVVSYSGEPLVPGAIFGDLPDIITPFGGVAAKFLPDETVEVLVMVSNASSDSSDLTPQNFLYRGVVGLDGNVIEAPTLIRTFSDSAQKPLFHGFATLGGDFYATAIELEAFDFNTDFTTLNKVDPTTGEIERIASFGGMIEGGLAGSDAMGRLYMLISVSEFSESSTGFVFGDVAAIAFDPRTSYISDAVFGGTGALEPAVEATIDPRVDLDFLRNALSDGSGTLTGLGLAFQGEQLVITADIEGVDGQRLQALLRVNFNSAVDPTSARLQSIEVIESELLGGLTFDIPLGLSVINPGNAASPVGAMFDPGPMGIDRQTIDPLFADVSYSQRALESGAVEALFLEAFLRSAQDPTGCVNSSLMAMVMPTLENRAEQSSGIGRASYDLRSMIDSEHPCSSVLGPPGGGSQAQ